MRISANLVGVAHAFGPVVHVQRKNAPGIEKGMAKHLLKEFEDPSNNTATLFTVCLLLIITN